MQQHLWRRAVGGDDVGAVIVPLQVQQDSGDLYSAELRITTNDQLLVSEMFNDERKLHARSMELFARLSD
jgi:hypothetical protein